MAHEPIHGDGVVLRPTTEADLPVLRAFFADPGFHERWGGRALADDEIAAKYLGRRSPDVECFVVEEHGRAVGLVQYHLADDGGEGGGMDLALMPEERGRGLGTAVVRALVAFVRTRRGWRRFTVDPDVDNAGGVAFWTKVGFEPVRMVDDEEGREPYWLMAWPARAAVRAMTADDISAVQAVEAAAGERFRSVPEPRIAACADHSPMPATSLREFLDAGAAWVAVDGGDVVGFVVARVVDGWAHVEEVAVAPDHGGRGHATALLETVAGWARAAGRPSVTLTTFRDVPWNRPFYERRGFRVLTDDECSDDLLALVAEEEREYGLPAELRVVMRRDLA